MRINQYFESDGNKLSYSCEVSSGKKNVGILFVHAAGGNRLGPHRMYVEMAKFFGKMGYATFRFDMRGCGDSDGVYKQNDIRTDVTDTLSAINFFLNYANLDKVILVGISKGARVCHILFSRCPEVLEGAILLSTSVINRKRVLTHLYELIRLYAVKLLQWNTIKRIFMGRVDTREVFKTLFWAVHAAKGQQSRKTKTKKIKIPVLLIYGDQDPIFKASCSYYSQLFKEHKIDYQCHIIQGGNHSFYHYKWKEEIIDLSRNWLRQIDKKGRDDVKIA